MKRLEQTLPHLILAAQMTFLSIPDFPVNGLKTWSLVAAVLTALLVIRQRRGEGMSSPINKGYLLYFIVCAAVFLAEPARLGPALSAAPGALLYGCLCAIAVVPALFKGQRFTEYFARRTTPAAVWQSELFMKINRDMSWMWAAIFALSALIGLIPGYFFPHALPAAYIVQFAVPLCFMWLVGTWLNKWYPGYQQRKAGIGPVSDSAGSAGRGAVEKSDEGTRKEEIMSSQFKVVAVNGSPHASVGNAHLMLQMMAPALRQEGIDLEEIFLADKRIEYCVGCGVCMEKGKCWRQDDHAGIVGKLLAADGVILASPVYFKHVTAQMKTFLDRSLAYGHKPRTTWKPGLAISVSAGMAETATAEYLAGLLRVYGAFSVGTFTAIGVGPGAFLGLEVVEARARDLALDLARAIKEKRRYPATDGDLFYYLFMGDLVRRQKDFMRDDYRHWQESGFYEGFEAFVGQRFAVPPVDEGLRKEWLRQMISQETAKAKAKTAEPAQRPASGPQSAASCRELLQMMPLGFMKEAAGDLKAVYQFEIGGAESFVAHLVIGDGRCVYVDGPHSKPDVTVKSPADVWLAISKGEMDGQSAFMTGKYKVEGNLALLMRLGTLFGA